MKRSIPVIAALFLLSFLTNFTNPAVQEARAEASPEKSGVASGAILDFLEALEQEHPGEVHSFILRRYGEVVAQGWWSPYQPESPHMLYSLSKSFTSTAIGIAQEEGLLSIDDPVISFFPQKLPDEVSENLRAMRISDLLKMNTGHQEDATGRMMGNDSWVEGFLALEVEHKPGTHFVYNSGASYMLAAIVQKVTGESVEDYLTPRLFEPLGIRKHAWEMSPEGINMGGWGLNLTTGAISRFGQLLLQEGKWEGRQLVPAEWVREATSLRTSNGSNPDSDWDQGYGYQFWMNTVGGFRGDGAFGQFCIVLPAQQAVLAITSGSANMGGIMKLAWKHLLPGMQDKPLPADEASAARLKQKLETLAVEVPVGQEVGKMARMLSGERYSMTENLLSITALEFEFGKNEQVLTITTTDDQQVIRTVYGQWTAGKMHVPRWESTQMAAAGRWTGDKSYELHIRHTETPYVITFGFEFEGDQVYMDTRLNVSMGPAEFPRITGKQVN